MEPYPLLHLPLDLPDPYCPWQSHWVLGQLPKFCPSAPKVPGQLPVSKREEGEVVVGPGSGPGFHRTQSSNPPHFCVPSETELHRAFLLLGKGLEVGDQETPFEHHFLLLGHC